MSITISAGHWKATNSGANGYINEVTEARKVTNRVVEILKAGGVTVSKVEDNTSTNQNSNLGYLVREHNKQKRDVDVSVHFNASGGLRDEGIGTEVLYFSNKGSSMAETLTKAISKAGGFKNRGRKYRDNLSFLRNTNKPAILLEVCFVNSREDSILYKKNFENICQAIAESLAKIVGKNLYKPVANKPEVKDPHRIKSGTYSSQEKAEIAKTLVVTNKIAGEKSMRVLSNNFGYYFQTGEYATKKDAENALQKMKDLRILTNGHIIKV